MIKQIWFVRNITRLFLGLSFTINLVISLYSLLSSLALTQTVIGENLIISMLKQYNLLLFFPLIGWFMFLVFWGLGIYLKRARKKFTKNKAVYMNLDDSQKKINLSGKEEMILLFLSHFITSTNLSMSITFAFFSLDVVSKAKGIPSFGMFPVFLCWGITWYYYSSLIFRLYKSKSEIV